MRRKLYVLLVGINRYPAGIPDLKGCVADVKDVRAFVEESLGHFDVHLEMLLDEEATRGNIIESFRAHLCRAGVDDAVWFHFSGHGSRTKAPVEFSLFEPDGMHESLVCYDSRTGGGLDLADKEMAVLFAEVARRNPHILATYDCCHSGSGVRDGLETSPIPRLASPVDRRRPLESYLDGYYKKHGLSIPNVKMVFFAASDKTEQAWEDENQRGVFSRILCEILRETKGRLSYTDLFLRLRVAMHASRHDQNPQLECYEGANAYLRFLDGWSLPGGKMYGVFKKGASWYIRCGQVNGVSMNPLSPTWFSLSCPGDSSSANLAIPARAVRVELQTSEIVIHEGYSLDEAKEYEGVLEQAPIPPLLVSLAGDLQGIELIEAVQRERKGTLVAFSRDNENLPLNVFCREGKIQLVNRNTGRLIKEFAGYTRENIQQLIMQLRDIECWYRLRNLDNRHTQLDKGQVSLRFCRISGNNTELRYGGDEIELYFDVEMEAGGGIPYRIKASNRDQRALFFTLLYFSPDYGIQNMGPCLEVPNTKKEVVLDNGHALHIPNRDVAEVEDTFVLIVSTERIDDFVFPQPGIGDWRQRDIRAFDKYQGDWFTKRITIKTAWATD